MKKYLLIVFVALGIFVCGKLFFGVQIHRHETQMQKHVDAAQKAYDALPAWKRKVPHPQELKIGIITDTHVHPKRIDRNNEDPYAPRKLKKKDVAPMERFVEKMAQFQPELIVHIGDVIEGTNDTDIVGIKGVELVREQLEKADVPIYWVVGNHDLRSITKEQFTQTLHMDALDYAFDVGDYRIVVLDGNFDKKDRPRKPPSENVYIRGNIPQEHLDWLERQLATDKHTLVFVHQGTFANDSLGDRKKKPNENGVYVRKMKQSLDNANTFNAILAKYNVDAVFNGHMEARRYDVIDGVAHYSLTGTKKSETYPGSFYTLTLTDGTPHLMMYWTPEGGEQREEVFERCADVEECLKTHE